MAAPSTYTWKNEAPWSDRICSVCGEKVKLNQGVFVSTTNKFIRHLWCCPDVHTFVSCGCDACMLAVDAINDARDSHEWGSK